MSHDRIRIRKHDPKTLSSSIKSYRTGSGSKGNINSTYAQQPLSSSHSSSHSLNRFRLLSEEDVNLLHNQLTQATTPKRTLTAYPNLDLYLSQLLSFSLLTVPTLFFDQPGQSVDKLHGKAEIIKINEIPFVMKRSWIDPKGEKNSEEYADSIINEIYVLSLIQSTPLRMHKSNQPPGKRNSLTLQVHDSNAQLSTSPSNPSLIPTSTSPSISPLLKYVSADDENHVALVIEYLMETRSSKFLDRLMLELRYEKMSAIASLKLIVGILKAIFRLHSYGIIHGDIKPENIYAKGTGETTRVVLVDFECSVNMSASHSVCYYRPPYLRPLEPTVNSRALCIHDDIFATTVVISKLLEFCESDDVIEKTRAYNESVMKKSYAMPETDVTTQKQDNTCICGILKEETNSSLQPYLKETKNYLSSVLYIK